MREYIPNPWDALTLPRGAPHTRRAVLKTYSDLLSDVKASVRTVALDELRRRLDAHEEYVLVDVREKDEVRQGFIPGAIHLPRGFLEMQAEQKLPEKKARIVVYCAGGTRAAFAAKTLTE